MHKIWGFLYIHFIAAVLLESSSVWNFHRLCIITTSVTCSSASIHQLNNEASWVICVISVLFIREDQEQIEEQTAICEWIVARSVSLKLTKHNDKSDNALTH